MDQATPSTASANTLHCALELSKKSWLLAIQFPDREQPSLYPIAGGEAERLMAKLTAARDHWAKVSGGLPMITLCYEVGYDAFWLARFLKARGIECLVIDPGSLQVSRRGRRVKTDRVDVKTLLRTLIAWCRGERHVWSLVRIPSIDEEDLRRSHRERSRLVRERTAHINRIKGLLFAQGIRRHQRQIPIQDLSCRRARDGRWSPLTAATHLRDRTGDPEACHGAGADCRDRTRA
jgi:transposase